MLIKPPWIKLLEVGKVIAKALDKKEVYDLEIVADASLEGV